MKPYKTVDEYLANFSGETRKKLDTIRKMIKKEIPSGEEVISYGIPTIKIEGKYIIYFAGYPNHVSIYPLPQNEQLREEIKSYIAGKGTLKFPLDKPLPVELIQKVIQAKLEDYKNRKK